MITKIPAFDNTYEYIIEDGDLKVGIMEYGATVHSIQYKGTECAAGYADTKDYVTGDSYQGATVGRYANRIANGRFSINGNEYTLDINNGINCLHGGNSGFSHRTFEFEGSTDNSVTLSITSADGEGGFPGNVKLCVTFSICDNTLKIEYNGATDKDTVLGFTNHVYFTLGADSALDTLLQIKADAITPINDNMIPTGEFMDVTGTAFDFRAPKAIGEHIKNDERQLTLAKGYDHNFVLGKAGEWKEDVAIAHNEKTGITLKCSTDLPGLQLYSGNWLNEPNGRGGALTNYCAFALETQMFPDSPNNPHFPSTLVKAGERLTTATKYKFEG